MPQIRTESKQSDGLIRENDEIICNAPANVCVSTQLTSMPAFAVLTLRPHPNVFLAGKWPHPFICTKHIALAPHPSPREL